jgi:hypothetical protein
VAVSEGRRDLGKLEPDASAETAPVQRGHGASLTPTAHTLLVFSKGAAIGWAVVLVLAAAAAFEVAIALEWISMGSRPGEEAAGQAEVTIAAFLALVNGIIAALISRRILRRWPATLVTLGAAAYMAAHYYAFDPYYLPSLRRFSDGGFVSPNWLYGVVAAIVIVALAVRRRPSVAPVLTPIALLVCAGTVLGEGVGH